MILVLDFDEGSSSRCLETESRLQGQKRIKYNTMKPEFDKKNANISFSLSVHCTDSENFFATESANLSKNTSNFPLTGNYSFCVIIKKLLKTIY